MAIAKLNKLSGAFRVIYYCKKERKMQKTYCVAIIGGGFSGLIAADLLSSALGGDKVLLLEKNDRVGKKILATGNGRGNITNLSLSAQNYHSVNGAFVDYAIEKYGNKSIIAYFNSLGVAVSQENERVYPSSFQANSVLDALRDKLEYSSAEIKVGESVKSVEKKGKAFKITTTSGEYFSQNVIFACGGKAGKQYGTDGSAYSLLKPFGHTVTKLYPSLVQVKTDTQKIKGLKGIKQQATVTAIVDGKKIKSFTGDLLFTDYGVSGNSIFNLTAYFPVDKKVSLSISFLPDKSWDEISSFIARKFETMPFIKGEEVLSGIINKQIGKAIVKNCSGLTYDAKGAKKLASAIKDFTLQVEGTLGFDYAQVTKGGVPFAEVNSSDMQSIKEKGLYIVGEMLDVDGDCGGYNLQWAYSSARLAVDGVLKEYENR